MNVFKKSVTLLLIGDLIASAAFAAAADQLREGISYYNSKNFSAAQDTLSKAVAGEFKQSALAHYYLANSLMQLRKTNAALVEYEQAYQLAPYSTFSGYCREMLMRHAKTAPATVRVPSSSAQRNAGFEPGSASNPVADVSADKKPFDDDTLRQLASRMPPIPKPEIENPPASVVLASSPQERFQFLNESLARKNRALEKLEQARTLLAKATTQSHSQIVSARAFGESDNDLKLRRENSEKLVNSLIEPFRNNVTNAERAFEEESRLYDSCLNARAGF